MIVHIYGHHWINTDAVISLWESGAETTIRTKESSLTVPMLAAEVATILNEAF